MNSFDFEDKIKFTKAVFYNFRPIPLPKPFQDGTGGFGRFIPEQGYLELSDDTGMTALQCYAHIFAICHFEGRG